MTIATVENQDTNCVEVKPEVESVESTRVEVKDVRITALETKLAKSRARQTEIKAAQQKAQAELDAALVEYTAGRITLDEVMTLQQARDVNVSALGTIANQIIEVETALSAARRQSAQEKFVTQAQVLAESSRDAWAQYQSAYQTALDQFVALADTIIAAGNTHGEISTAFRQLCEVNRMKVEDGLSLANSAGVDTTPLRQAALHGHREAWRNAPDDMRRYEGEAQAHVYQLTSDRLRRRAALDEQAERKKAA